MVCKIVQGFRSHINKTLEDVLKTAFVDEVNPSVLKPVER